MKDRLKRMIKNVIGSSSYSKINFEISNEDIEIQLHIKGSNK